MTTLTDPKRTPAASENLPLSAEIQRRAYAFSERWKEAKVEIANSQTFWNEFLTIFGVDRVTVAGFEVRVRTLGKRGRVDLLWPGVLLVEQKSRGSDLDRAQGQAAEYVLGLSAKERPKFVIVSDFERLRLIDLQNVAYRPVEVVLHELHSKIHLFDFVLGGASRREVDEVLVNTRAAELMGELHDALRKSPYQGTALEVFLVRVMFCLFADHTGIFDEKRQFTEYVEQHSDPNGSNLGVNLNEFFRILDLDPGKRPSTLGPLLSGLPHVDGGLFRDRFDPPTFDGRLRDLLVKCCHYDWSGVSPAIFGTMFQSVTSAEERRNLGAHYTSETNVLKVIRPLFLDQLKVELAACGNNKRALNDLLIKISRLRFLDPACGCGNFLAIAYRELRKIDTEVRVRLKNLTLGREQNAFAQSMRESMKGAIDVDHFFGIEIEEFPCKIAEAALWLMDHKSNREYSEAIGDHYVRLPLLKTAVIVRGNAIRLEWDKILPREEVSFVLGNPPYSGVHLKGVEQREDLETAFASLPKPERYRSLDYVSAWYLKAAKYVQGTKARIGFVSTKSITQGEQVGPLWSTLLDTLDVKIQFAHQPFRWANEAKGQAAVQCVIIGLGLEEPIKPVLYEYETPDGDPKPRDVRHINPYLVAAPDVLLFARAKPLCAGVPEAREGNKPTDGGNYLFTEEEKIAFLAREPGAEKYMVPWIGADEFINGIRRYCLFLRDADPSEIRGMPEVMKRVDAVRAFRLRSTSASTRKAAETPRRFYFENFPKTNFIVIPAVSSERRRFIPMGYLTPGHLCGNAVKIISNATMYHFGVMMSSMHAAWTIRVSGRLEGRYQYSDGVVYNNFPWPKGPSASKIEAVERSARELLAVRERLLVPDTSLADLYDPLAMPADMVRAHKNLDRSVELCYRPKLFKSDAARVGFLFQLYQEYARVAVPLETFVEGEES